MYRKIYNALLKLLLKRKLHRLECQITLTEWEALTAKRNYQEIYYAYKLLQLQKKKQTILKKLSIL